jgi:ribonucleotide reductase alpha subunit
MYEQDHNMHGRLSVIKRNGESAPLSLDKIAARLEPLCGPIMGVALDISIDPTKVMLETAKSIGTCNGLPTSSIDEIAAKAAYGMQLTHPDYSNLAARILVSNMHKSTPDRFSECITLQSQTIPMNPTLVKFITDNADRLDAMIDNTADYGYTYLGVVVLKSTYLVKQGGRIIDRPQYMLMRVAVAMYAQPERRTGAKGPTPLETILVNIYKCYTNLSQKHATHATPTLYNACMSSANCVSCFLLGTHDSAEGINFATMTSALISKSAGGLGQHLGDIRSANSLIHSTLGRTTSVVKLLQIENASMRKWNQGGRRSGSKAVYMPIHHGDIMDFINAALRTTSAENTAPDLYYALMIPDLFYNVLDQHGEWYLFSDDSAPGLNIMYDGMEFCSTCGFCNNLMWLRWWYINVYGAKIAPRGDPGCIYDPTQYGTTFVETIAARAATMAAQAADRSAGNVPISQILQTWYAEHPECNPTAHNYERKDAYTELYNRYKNEGRAVGRVQADDVLSAILNVRRLTGMPFVCSKDSINRMSNQANYGTVQCSNLCTEIMQVSMPDSYACCVLASLNLPSFINDGRLREFHDGKITVDDVYDFTAFGETVGQIVRNLDSLIDVNEYPTPECRRNALDTRSIGVGLQGLADVCAILRIPFLSAVANNLKDAIVETMYHSAVMASTELAREYGTYPFYDGSPASRGKLHHDLYDEEMNRRGRDVPYTTRCDWAAARAAVAAHGLRNSLLIALMPTVTTSQILGNNESFEAFESNIYAKTTQHGKFTIINQHMIRHLIELGIWNEQICAQIIAANGSVQGVAEIPPAVREIYKTVYELRAPAIIDSVARMQRFVDQGTSINMYLTDNSEARMASAFRYAPKTGLKTCQYYLRIPPAAQAPKNNLTAIQTAPKVYEVTHTDACAGGSCSA